MVMKVKVVVDIESESDENNQSIWSGFAMVTPVKELLRYNYCKKDESAVMMTVESENGWWK